MKLELHGMIDVNCYILENNGSCFIIDPGFEAERIREAVAKKGLSPRGILLTHAHVDHIGESDCLPLPVYVHKVDKPLLADDTKNGFALFGVQRRFNPAELDIREIQEGSEIQLEGKTISVLHTPGHTAGSVCYLFDDELYSGDTLFMRSVGRSDLPTGSAADLTVSVKRLIETLPENTRVHPGHGESTTIALEKSLNPWYKYKV